jgi:CRP-like cAMP-binding protein
MDLLRLRADLEPVLLARGTVLSDADQPLTHVYFVETAVLTLVTVLKDRAGAGVALVGREGLIGIAALLGGDTAIGRHLVHVPGSVLALEVSRFRSALQASRELRAPARSSSRCSTPPPATGCTRWSSAVHAGC